MDQSIARAPVDGPVTSQTLSEFAAEWWLLYAEPNLTPKTLESYGYLWAAYVEPELGGEMLDSLTPLRLERWKSGLLVRGIGTESVKRTLTMLQGVLQRAVEWQCLSSNPARLVRRPPSPRRRAVRPIPPVTVERIRAHLVHHGRPADAVLVSVLAYAGLRPGEALALTWSAVGARSLLVEQCVSMGQLKSTKTGRTRTIRLLRPLIEDLDQHRTAQRPSDEESLVFPHVRGGLWSDGDWRNWRRRAFKDASRAAGRADSRPYDLRHSFVSLLIAEGQSVIDVARQAGHNPTMTLSVYGHVFDEFDPLDRKPAADRIDAARREFALNGSGSDPATSRSAETHVPGFAGS
jgi:integrase